MFEMEVSEMLAVGIQVPADAVSRFRSPGFAVQAPLSYVL